MKNKDVNSEQEDIVEDVNSDNEIDQNEEIVKLKEKLEELEDQNLRLQAEIQNMRRRNQKDRQMAIRYQSQDLATEILPVIDNLERALEAETTNDTSNNLKDGISMVLESFKRALSAEGIEEIEAEDVAFDPKYHEAYAQVPAKEGQESGMVAEVYEKGYKLHDRVLRAAKVTVVE